MKLFLPSWNFFDDFAAVPMLEAAAVDGQEQSSDWRPLFGDYTTRSLARIFFNPKGNLDLLESSLVGRAADELEGLPDRTAILAGETYLCLTRLARQRWATLSESTATTRFRFRIVRRELHGPVEVVFESEPLATKGDE